MESREDRIRAKAHQLWEDDGRRHGLDRAHWERAAQIVDEEERHAAQAATSDHKPPVPGIPDSSPSNDPIGVTLTAMRRQS